MHKRMVSKRITCILLSFLMITTVIPTDVYAAEFDTGAVDSASYFTVISNNQYNLAPGAVETEMVINSTAGDDRKVVHVFEVDTKNENVEVLPGYYGIDKLNPDDLANDGPSGRNVWKAENLTKTVEYYENTLGYNVVGAMNTALAYDSDAPYGYMVWDGVVLGTPEVHKGSKTYLAINNDGTCELRSMSTPLTGNEKTAVSANFDWLVKDGKLTTTKVERTSSDASRSMIGIKADGKLVFCQVDGRNAPVSTGLSNYEMGEMMLALGCVNAVNCDGGGSSTFVSQRPGDADDIMRSIPSDGAERATINSVIIVSKVKATGVFDHAILDTDYDYYAPGTSATIEVNGVDPSGAIVDLPTEGITWAISDESLGSVSNGVFTSNGTKGTVVVSMLYNDNEVGSKTIHIVDPKEFKLVLDETVLPYGKTMDIEFDCIYGADNWPVYVEGAYTLTLSDTNAATLSGNTLTATSDESLLGVDVVASYNPNPEVKDTLKISFGKGSELLFDFEDGNISNFLGVDEMYDWATEHGASAPIQSNGNYSEDADSETFLSSVENGGQVRNGKYALGVVMDYTDAQFAGWSYNMFFYVGDESLVLRDVANGKNATTLGMWIYIPEGAAGLAMQIQGCTKPDGTGGTGADLKFTTVSGAYKNLNGISEADIPESRWVYATVDLTQFGDYFATYNPYGTTGREPSFIRHYVKPTTPANLVFYYDDITLDYSSAVEDRVLPTITNPSYATEDTMVGFTGNDVLNKSTVAFSANVADNVAIDATSGKILVDGIELNDVTLAGKVMSSGDVTLLPGEHTVTFEIKDKIGNLAKVTKTFKVAGDELVSLGGHNDKGTLAEYDSIYYIDINVKDITTINKLTTTLKLQTANTWEIEGAEVAKGFTATYDVNTLSGLVTVTVEKTGEVEDTNTLVSLPVRVWSWGGVNHVTDVAITPEEQFKTGYCPIVAIDCKVIYGDVEITNSKAFNSFGGSFNVATKLNDIVNPWHYHDVELTVLNKEATCTENGYENRTYCETCKSVIDWGVAVDATGHTYEKDENNVLKCSCGELFNGQYEDGKHYVDGVVVQDGWAGDYYFKDGSKVTGYQLIDGCYYYFDENGVCKNQTKYTGLLYVDNSYYYSLAGEFVNGWQNIDGTWHYFRSGTKKAANGKVTCQVSGAYITYTFNEDGSLAYEPWVKTESGWRYFYGPKYYSLTWATIDGERYYFDANGYRFTGYKVIKDSRYSHDDDYRLYRFAEDGKLLETSEGNGLLITEDGTFYLEDGYAKYKGLIYVDGEYYYINSNRRAVVGEYTISLTNGLLEPGTYQFAEDGKMIKKNGIEGDYYYIDGIIQKTGLIEINGDIYYFSTTNGKMSRNTTRQVNIVHESCTLPVGKYTFDKDGKLVMNKKNGIIGDYYYINDEIQKTGLIKLGGNYYYFSTTDGHMSRDVIRQVNIVHYSCDLPKGTYAFDANGKMIEGEITGIIAGYYYINGVIQKTGLTKVGDDYYYFSTTDGHMTKNTTRIVYQMTADCNFRPGYQYTFDNEGKLVLDRITGIYGDYYYINGVMQKTGLTKVGNDYCYFSTTDGHMTRSTTRLVYQMTEDCNFKVGGTYSFDSNGKMILN